VKALPPASGIFHVRSLLLVSVLVALCVSEGIGLQLLPIPGGASVPVALAEAKLIKTGTDVPSPHRREKSVSDRIEIVAPKLKGLSHQQSIQIITAALLATRHPDVSLPVPVYSEKPASGYSFIFSYQGASRAPPRLG
jgi:hypothetical protein